MFLTQKRPRSPTQDTLNGTEPKKQKLEDSTVKSAEDDLQTKAIERARRAEELQKQIQEQLAQLQQQKKLESSKVMMDAKGNLVDENGNIIRLPSRPVATFLANKN